ncbi:VOC family protein, partial [Ralstonia pseudosolanacearum]|uniref:VOC family protein n=1 Tax=Ralstonia pseudosolanacearum TaxID=1310165 RepID=UPI003D1770EE
MIDHLDHLVLTSTQPDATIDFYTRVLGMQLERFGEGRIAFRFGNQKINLHVRGQEFEPKAHGAGVQALVRQRLGQLFAALQRAV